jgi:hypothetical protein
MSATDKNTAPPPPANEESDQARLRRLWCALLDRLLAEVAKPEARASTLEVCRAFLRDNRIAANTPRDLRDGLASLRDLPFNH